MKLNVNELIETSEVLADKRKPNTAGCVISYQSREKQPTAVLRLDKVAANYLRRRIRNKTNSIDVSVYYNKAENCLILKPGTDGKVVRKMSSSNQLSIDRMKELVKLQAGRYEYDTEDQCCIIWLSTRKDA